MVIERLDSETTEVFDLFYTKTEPGVRDRLIEAYLPLAESLSRRYQHSGQPLDDLVQVASIGLVKAVDRFDPERGVTFESYAIPTILGELKRYHRDQGWSVRMPRRLQEHTLQIKDAVPVLAQDLGRSPRISEIAAHTQLSEEEVLEAMDAQDAYASISLDAPIDDDSDSATLSDRLHLDEDDFSVAEEWAEFEPHLRALPDRERRIIVLRFFRDWTQSQIAEELGISQMHVSRLLSQTLQKLREAVAGVEEP
jgi:RNA polymerase sigma-B factor